MDVSIGDWTLLKARKDETVVEKVITERIKMEFEDEIMETVMTIRNIESYNPTGKVLSNFLRNGLLHFPREEEGEKERAEELENSWMIQVHR